MTLLQNPQKKVESILRNIEKGMTHEGDTSSIMQILEKQPSMIPEVILSAGFIMERLSDGKKGLNEYEWMPILELFTRINERHPENMKTAVHSLLSALGNSNKTVRENAYFLLVSIADKNPDFFEYSSSELIRNLNGLNLDERLYACKIIGLIAAKNPRIVEKTYDVIEDFSLNHPDSNLRSEAGFVANLLRPKTNTAKQPESKVPLVKQDDKGSELKSITNEIAPQKNETIGIKNKSQIENALQILTPGRVIESAVLVGRSGRIIAQSGSQIDSSILLKITSIMSFDSEDQSMNRISIEQADKKIVAVGVGNKAVLVVVTGADTSMGMLLIILNKSVDKLNGILMDAGFTETL